MIGHVTCQLDVSFCLSGRLLLRISCNMVQTSNRDVKYLLTKGTDAFLLKEDIGKKVYIQVEEVAQPVSALPESILYPNTSHMFIFPHTFTYCI